MIGRLVAALAVMATAMGGAQASEPGLSDWSVNETGRVRLVAARTHAGAEPSVKLGLHFQLQPGWKMYWRTPGDAGYPPKIDWSGSDNVGEAQVAWPAPKRFELAGLQNYGYAGEVILPVEMAVARPGAAVRLRAQVDYLACEKICVPMNAKVGLDLAGGDGRPTAAAHDLSRFLALVPGDGARHGLAIEAVEALGDTLVVTARAEPAFDTPDLFVEPAELGAFGAPSVRLEQGGRQAVITLSAQPGSASGPLVGAMATLTLVDGMRSMEASRPIAAAATPPAAPAADGTASLLAMLGVALLGGLILNLMPCVLPVLSIKVLGALGHGGAERGHIRAAFLASGAGIVVSFLGLAAAATALKLAGAAVGWGIQFQQPAFLVVMIALLLAFAANLWGAFEIPLPTFLTNVGASGQPHHTLVGHFLSGAFATLLATPCSAPFLGTAIGFALARGPSEIFVIFAMLGVGMAAPYLLVAAWPDAARRLPRPGPWMLTVKKVMGVALAATALWLGGILATQSGWLGQDGPTSEESAKIVWAAFDEQAIAREVAAGRVVFVDVTADWCITCKVNKAAVIDRGEVAARLASGQVVAMRADWTRPDDTIARYLASFGRYGIPFNAVYGPKAPGGVALPELLTQAEVLAAIERAR